MNKDVINRLRETASKGVSVWGDLQMEAADALDRLTGGDVAIPKPDTHCFDEDTGSDVWSYSAAQLRDYGDRRAAAMVREPLTDEQIIAIRDRYHRLMAPFEFARAIEKAHGITGETK